MARRFGSILLALFLVAFAFIPGAEAWSEPVQTKQWSEPEYTEPWSEPEYTEPWSEPVYTEPWSEPVYTEPWTEPEYVDPWAETVETDLWDPKLPGEEVGEIDPFLLDFEALYGIWFIWTQSTPLGGPNVQHGKDQGVVSIQPDGTYTILHQAWNPEPVEGTWRLSYLREINDEVVQGIVLVDGPADTDWAVAPEPGGKIRLLWAMKWADGSALWFFDSELYR